MNSELLSFAQTKSNICKINNYYLKLQIILSSRPKHSPPFPEPYSPTARYTDKEKFATMKKLTDNRQATATARESRCSRKVSAQKHFGRRSIFALIAVGLLSCFSAPSVSAQYYEIANQIPQLISPALSGSTNYKGFVEASYIKGVGDNKADFLEFTTTQGFRYSSWFFMGVGAGVDIMFSHPNDDWGNWNGPANGFDVNHSSTTTSVMIPLYTDFRFNIGSMTSPSFYADVRLGAAFLVGKDYVRIGDGFITNQQYFYLRPSIGLRVPTNKSGVQAFNVGLSYQLITSNYWSGWSRNTTLNALGVNLSYEW